MAAPSENTQKTLPTIFDEIWKDYQYLDTSDEPTISDKFQDHVKKMTENVEKAIRMVNQLSLFSDNEEIEEVSTNELRYMLLPALVGYASSKNTKSERIDVVKKAQESYQEYLRLVTLYKLTNVQIPGSENGAGKGAVEARGRGDPQAELISQAHRRKEKIERFRQQKQNEAKLKELYISVNKAHVDDEVKREYHLTLLKTWIDTSLEELESIQDELPILEHMAKMRSQGQKEPDLKKETSQQKPRKPMKPFIITRDQVQAKVIGAGYPSLPTYTLEEFYEQNYKDSQPEPESSNSSLQRLADLGATNEEEAGEIEKERNVETDDAETLQKARDMDEFKDDHRRGWGNRQNRS